MALLYVLASLKISPDYIVGESFGELAAAYADNVLTAEEAVLSAYAIGSVLAEAKIAPSQDLLKVVKQLQSALQSVSINTSESAFPYGSDGCFF